VFVLATILFVTLWVRSRIKVNADKTKYVVTSRDQNAGRSQSEKIDNHSFEKKWKSSNIWERP
jgi:hypothetical protein